MELLGMYNLRYIVKFVIHLIFFTYLFLIWNFNCDKSTFGKSLELKYEQDGSLNKSFNRLLAKHEPVNDSYKTYARQGYANYGTNKNIKSEEIKKPTKSRIRKDCLNNFDAYMQDYKYRYAKKKGIAKLDCYYENKVLKKINNIFEITDNMNNKKKYYNKKIYNKYIMRLILFGLIPLLGTIIPLLFGEHSPLKDMMCFSNCLSDHNESPRAVQADKAAKAHQDKNIYLSSIHKDTFGIIEIVNKVFLYLSLFIVILILLYVLLKIIKYARIKSGKGKMSVKDYCHFCKDLFIAK
ncbi:hypothetical protein PVIIG_06546 [Plasmodium vivax India VII]|uniref:Variable surface protein Vir35 n=1 Tax=Plasmodium vivax India VII TaxID=1077284 RepID=A0A0J9S2Z7_PLAVI|nr:hypothetical protein PVIIG_06546 [Plasmodium vivax India VII]